MPKDDNRAADLEARNQYLGIIDDAWEVYREAVERAWEAYEASLAPFLNGRVELLPFCIPSPVESVDEQAWRAGGRKFMMMINGNKRPRLYVQELYTERLRALSRILEGMIQQRQRARNNECRSHSLEHSRAN